MGYEGLRSYVFRGHLDGDDLLTKAIQRDGWIPTFLEAEFL
jgi:hypothetical protein